MYLYQLIPLGIYDRSKEENSFWGRTHSEAAKDKIRAAALVRETPNKPGTGITVFDTFTGVSTTYPSIRKAAEAMKWDQSYIVRFLAKSPDKLYRKQYKLIVNK